MPGRRAATIPGDPPVPPRLLIGFLEPTGHTVSRGAGYISAGYLGTSLLAQAGDIVDVQPYVVHAAYGVTEELMVSVGSGTATVTVMASDPSGLSAEQGATVTVNAEQARTVSMQPEMARPGQPTVDEGSAR